MVTKLTATPAVLGTGAAVGIVLVYLFVVAPFTMSTIVIASVGTLAVRTQRAKQRRMLAQQELSAKANKRQLGTAEEKELRKAVRILELRVEEQRREISPLKRVAKQATVVADEQVQRAAKLTRRVLIKGRTCDSECAAILTHVDRRAA